MNIFVLDYDMKKSAEYTADKHVIKMILEQTQILSTVYHLAGQENLACYKKTHVKHPCVLWAFQDLNNWLWLKEYTLILADEYTHRYNKNHACKAKVLQMEIIPDIPNMSRTDFKQCMPDQYKYSGDSIQSYRNYYIGEKSHLFKWTKRSIPDWINERLELD